MGITQLPIAESPVVGLQYLAYQLCILFNDEESFPWFHSNYIQLMWSSDFSSHFTFFPNWISTNPMLYVQLINKDIIKTNDIKINNFIMNCINSGEYFYSTFDEFYVPHRAAYGKEHFIHDFLIYGYDSIQKEYILLGFNEKWIFGTSRIGFKEFEEAFFFKSMRTENIHLITKKDDLKYGFDLQLVYEMLDDYLNSRNSSQRARVYGDTLTNRIFGLDVYKVLRKYFELLISDNIDFDIRPLHMLLEHKKCMILRLEYMYNNHYIDSDSYIYDEYTLMKNEVMAMRNLQLKYAVTGDKNYLNGMVNTLSKIEQKEKELLEILLDKIHSKLQNFRDKDEKSSTI